MTRDLFFNYWRRASLTGAAEGAAVVEGEGHIPILAQTSVGFRLSLTRPLMISGRLFSMMESQIFSRVGSKESREQSPSTNSMMSSMVESLVIHSSMSVTMSTQMSHRRSLGCSTLPAWAAEAMIRRERATEYMMLM